jgi:hypothetical protein
VRLLEAERQRLLRELALKIDVEEGYARRGAAQGAALKRAGVSELGAWARGACHCPADPLDGGAGPAAFCLAPGTQSPHWI